MSSYDLNQILATIRQLESGGSYTARNSTSSASGAYQFIDSTWGGYGGYAHAYLAPPAVQDAKALLNVQSILSRYGGNLEAVPAAWYTGHYDPNNLDYTPAGNQISVRGYINKWMGIYNGTGGQTSGASADSGYAGAAAANPLAAADTTGQSLGWRLSEVARIFGHTAPTPAGFTPPDVAQPGPVTPLEQQTQPERVVTPGETPASDQLTGPR